MSDDIDDDAPEEVPDGAAVFPEIPTELGCDPLLLATLHATVFLAGSDEALVNGAAAEEALQYMATYLGRMSGPQLRKAKEDIKTVLGYARDQGWPKQLTSFLKSFLSDFGLGGDGSP